MTLPYGQFGVEVRFFDGKTRVYGEKVTAGTQSLPIEAYIQIGRADFKLIPISSLFRGLQDISRRIGVSKQPS